MLAQGGALVAELFAAVVPPFSTFPLCGITTTGLIRVHFVRP